MTPSASGPAFEIPDRRPLIDEPVAVRLIGTAPGSTITVRAGATDSQGGVFRSWAEFDADGTGAVDLAAQAPREGSYAGADGFGLWWSMTAAPNRAFADGVDPVVTELVAEVDGEIAARARLDRRFLGPDVTRADLDEDGLVGTLFRPAARSGAAAMVVGGSGGGVRWSLETAALLASRGIAALALGYFGLPGLPPSLREIPLEYFERALAWLARREAADRVGLVGSSRGGELALLLASTYPDAIGAVVALGPSAVLWSAGRDPASGRLVASWARGGRGLPSLAWNHERARELMAQGATMSAIFLDALATGDGSLGEASIPVERMRAPLLAISGEDDRIWPSAHFADMVRQRAGDSVPVRHLVYAAAGHGAGKAPGLPACDGFVRHPVDGVLYATGGTMAGFAAAGADVWPRTLEFLREQLMRHR